MKMPNFFAPSSPKAPFTIPCIKLTNLYAPSTKVDNTLTANTANLAIQSIAPAIIGTAFINAGKKSTILTATNPNTMPVKKSNNFAHKLLTCLGTNLPIFGPPFFLPFSKSSSAAASSAFSSDFLCCSICFCCRV